MGACLQARQPLVNENDGLRDARCSPLPLGGYPLTQAGVALAPLRWGHCRFSMLRGVSGPNQPDAPR